MRSGIVHHKSDRKSCVIPTADRNSPQLLLEKVKNTDWQYCISWKITSCAYIQIQHRLMRLFFSMRLFLYSYYPPVTFPRLKKSYLRNYLAHKSGSPTKMCRKRRRSNQWQVGSHRRKVAFF